MSVFCLVKQWINEEGDGFELSVYGKYLDAKRAFEYAVQDERAIAEEEDLVEDVDENNDYASFYQDGFYADNHYEVFIQEKEVE